MVKAPLTRGGHLDQRRPRRREAFDDVLETRDFTPLDPDVEEHKFYAWGVGPVEVRQTSGGFSHEVLLTFKPG